MKRILLGIALALTANLAIAEEEVNMEVLEILRSCESDGYFVYEAQLYMCNFIRADVTDADLDADELKMKKRAMNRWRQRWGIEEE